MRTRLFTDGGARGNPGPAAYGFVLEAEDGTVLAAEGEAIGTATNNVAEYSGLIAGLRKALDLQLADVAQLARASAGHAEGRGFESHHPLKEAPGKRGLPRARRRGRRRTTRPVGSPRAQAGNRPGSARRYQRGALSPEAARAARSV